MTAYTVPLAFNRRNILCLVRKTVIFRGVSKEKQGVDFGQMRQKERAKWRCLVYFLQSPQGGFGKLDIFADEETIDFLPLY